MNAAESDGIGDENTFYSPEFGAYVNAYKITDNGLQELTEEENEEVTEVENLDSNSTRVHSMNQKTLNDSTIMDYRETKKFKPTKSTRYVGDPIKVTQDIGCTVSKGCSIGYGVSYTTTVSVSYTANSNSDKGLIKSALGITYSKAKATTISFTYNLKKGEKGYVAFKPYKIKKDGYFQLCGNQGVGCRKTSQTGYARVPVKLKDGKADGIFYFVLK
ncbi:hypothetical protein P4534_07060 [Peribacillus butanolivorans]|uniref:DUF6060 domain-containing protein n=1 Tax=Peribacillus butanolivorans TaxID=421767 RepID=UPI002E1E15B9|nr:hypothetical protein [Peribacillus butanolivorans]